MLFIIISWSGCGGVEGFLKHAFRIIVRFKLVLMTTLIGTELKLKIIIISVHTRTNVPYYFPGIVIWLSIQKITF